MSENVWLSPTFILDSDTRDEQNVWAVTKDSQFSVLTRFFSSLLQSAPMYQYLEKKLYK